MNKLSKSAVVLIVLAAAAIILGVVLFITMPESLSESIGHGQFMERGAAHNFMQDGAARRSAFYGHSSHMRAFSFSFLLIIAAVLFFIFRGRAGGYSGRKNHSRAILDEMYAEEKITLEQYRRKRTVLEEEN